MLLLVRASSTVMVFRLFSNKQTEQNNFAIVGLGVTAVSSDGIVVN